MAEWIVLDEDDFRATEERLEAGHRSLERAEEDMLKASAATDLRDAATVTSGALATLAIYSLFSDN